MFVVDLMCKGGHGFEGWFEHADDVRAQLEDGALECPTCGGRDIERRLGFRGIGGSKNLPVRAHPTAMTAPAPEGQAPKVPMPIEVQKVLSAVLRAVRAHGEDVGAQFATVARRIHAGEEENRLVYGSSTPDEARGLLEDGVPFAAIPIPEIDEN